MRPALQGAEPSSLYPDFPAAITCCRPSAPAFDRICWPFAAAKALAGLSLRTYRRWGIAPRP